MDKVSLNVWIPQKLPQPLTVQKHVLIKTVSVPSGREGGKDGEREGVREGGREDGGREERGRKERKSE